MISRRILLGLGLTLLCCVAQAGPVEELAPLAPFIGTWESDSGPPGMPDSRFRNVYEWDYAKAVIRTKTYLIRGESALLAYETLFAWDARRNRIVAAGVGRLGMELTVVDVSVEGGLRVIKTNFTPFIPGEAAPHRSTLTLSEDGKSFKNLVEKPGEEGKWVMMMTQNWTKKG